MVVVEQGSEKEELGGLPSKWPETEVARQVEMIPESFQVARVNAALALKRGVEREGEMLKREAHIPLIHEAGLTWDLVSVDDGQGVAPLQKMKSPTFHLQFPF